MGCCSGKTETKERIKIDGYHLERVSQIAEGAYGTIWQCYDPRSKQTYALKQMNLDSPERKEVYRKEVSMLTKIKKLQIKGAVSLKASDIQFRGENKIGRMLFELGTSSLFDDIDNRQKDFSDKKIYVILRDICQALNELHTLNIYHLDIKPQNILRVDDKYKLCDFGSVMTERVEYDSLENSEKRSFEDYIERNSTPQYRAPEMIEPQGKVVVAKADMWMLGCVAYVLAFGRYPLEGEELESMEAHKNIKYDRQGELTDLIKWMLSMDPKDRPTSKQLLKVLNKKIKSKGHK